MTWRRTFLIGLLALSASFAAAQQRPVLSADQASQETTTFLCDLVRIDTHDPPGNESKVAEYLAAIFKKENIPYEILETLPGRASIVARLKGNGTRRPVLLLAHEDVVPVDRSQWTVDPFAAKIKSGILYGRGASDDKSPLAANLETMLQLHRAGTRLSRDIIFLAEASEETSSTAGMRTLVDRYWDRIDCEFALNEGGAAEIKDGKIAYIGVATGEKLPRGVRLVAKGQSGHASVPTLDNPITHLAEAVGRLGTWETPMRLNATTQEFFSRLATISPADQAALFTTLQNPLTETRLHEKLPLYYSMLHTTVVPTVLRGGFKSNVIPSQAEAEIDIRALPDENMPAFYEEMQRVINDPSIHIEEPDLTNNMPAAPSSSIQTPMFEALEAVQKKLLPEAITVPVMTTGATDSAFLRAKGVLAYGIRVPRTFEENEGVHGDDERIELQYVNWYQRFVQEAVQRVAM